MLTNKPELSLRTTLNQFRSRHNTFRISQSQQDKSTNRIKGVSSKLKIADSVQLFQLLITVHK